MVSGTKRLTVQRPFCGGFLGAVEAAAKVIASFKICHSLKQEYSGETGQREFPGNVEELSSFIPAELVYGDFVQSYKHWFEFLMTAAVLGN